MSKLLDLLSDWPEGQCLPELWRALEAGDESVNSVAADWLEQLAIPRSLGSCMEALVDRGAFAAAELLLSVAELGNAEFNEWQNRLESARSEAREHMEDELARLLTRSSRARCPTPDFQARAEEIAILSAQDRKTAENRRQGFEDEIEQCESLYRRELLAELERRFESLQSDPRVLAWKARVERGILAGHFDLATESLNAGPGENLDEALLPLPPPPKLWPFSNESTPVVCSWLREGGEAPPDFFSTWAPERGDDVAEDLIEKLGSLVSPGATEMHALQFLQSFEHYLGIRPEPGRPIRPTASGFVSVMRGLYHPAMPAFNPLRFPEGVPIMLVIRESGAPPEITPGALLVFSEPQLEVPLGIAEIKPQELFRLLPEREHRKRQMLRFIGSQIKLDDALCPSALQPHSELFFDRETQTAAIRSSDHCIYGVPGVGKTALLKRILFDLGNQGWQQLYLDASASDATLLDELDRSAASDPDRVAKLLSAASRSVVSREEPGLALGIDRAEILSGSALAFLARCLARRDPSIRLFLVGSPNLRQRLDSIPFPRIQYLELGPLSFDVVRRFAEEILDLHGLKLSGEDILDRIAYASSGRPALLLLLLRELFTQHEILGPTRHRSITNHLLDMALGSDGFRESAITAMFQPINRDPDLQCILAAFLLEANEEHEPHSGVTESDVRLWLSLASLDFAEGEIDRGLDSLRQLGIVERRGLVGELFLARGTLGFLARALIDSPMSFLEGERHRRFSSRS
jgi:AAA domain-containing protein